MVHQLNLYREGLWICYILIGPCTKMFENPIQFNRKPKHVLIIKKNPHQEIQDEMYEYAN